MRAALQLSRLAFRPDGSVRRAAVGRYRRARSAIQRQNSYQSISRGGQGWLGLGVPGTAARASGSRLGAVLVEERLRADCLRGRALQLAPVPGEFNRSAAFRVDAHELERPFR